MKIIEKIINAFLVVQHKKIQVKNITFLDNGQGMFSGMSFDADVSLEVLRMNQQKHIVLVSLIFPFQVLKMQIWRKLRNFN